jgi:methionyl-tRNA synthetase
LAVVMKYRGGSVPAPNAYDAPEIVIIARTSELPSVVLALVDEMKVGRAVEQVMEFVTQLNGYIASSTPWTVAKDPNASNRLDTVLYTLLEAIYNVSNLMFPVMPGKMRELQLLLGVSGEPCWNLPWGNGVKPERKIKEGILFPKRLSGSVV